MTSTPSASSRPSPTTTPKERLRAAAAARLQRQIEAAREDPAEFAALVGRTDKGRRIKMSAVHREWQAFFSCHERAILFAPFESGKSEQITRWRLLWELGRNPNLRAAIISATDKHPTKMLRGIKDDIVRNPLVRAVFPHLRPSREQRLWTAKAIIVERSGASGDPSIQVVSPRDEIQGARLDHAYIDDIVTPENTQSEERREQVWNFLTGALFSRSFHAGTRIWVLANTLHPNDAVHRLERSGYATRRDSAIVVDEKGVERSLIPEFWTLEMIRAKAKELGPLRAPGLLFNRLLDEGAGRIKRAWFDECLKRGRGLELVRAWDPRDAPTYTAVDIGFTRDRSVIFTVAVLPDDSRRILDVRSGRWLGVEFIRELLDVHAAYGSVMAIEGNGAQRFLQDFARDLTALPITNHVTRADNKHHVQWGVESVAVELANAKWIIPCDERLVPHPEVQRWIDESVSYSPRDHMGDALSASWICRELIRLTHTSYHPLLDNPLAADLLLR